jgi:hypothetical protein
MIINNPNDPTKVLKSGDTMTGNLIISNPGAVQSNYFLNSVGSKFVLQYATVGVSDSPAVGSGGQFFPVQATTASAPTFVAGALWWDSTRKKLIQGEGAVWEVVSSVAATPTALTAGATVSLVASANECYTLTPGEDETINASSVPLFSKRITIVVTTSGTTSWNLTFGTAFKTVGVLATGTVSGKVFTISFISDGTNLNEVSRTGAM